MGLWRETQCRGRSVYSARGTVVATVSEIKPAGVRPFAEVKGSLRPAVLRKKKIEKAMQIAAEVRAKLGPSDSLKNAVATFPGAKVAETGEFTASGFIQGVGHGSGVYRRGRNSRAGQDLEPGAGAARRLSHRRDLADTVRFDNVRSTPGTIENQMLQEKKSRFLNLSADELRESAEIVDNRDVFYR